MAIEKSVFTIDTPQFDLRRILQRREFVIGGAILFGAVILLLVAFFGIWPSNTKTRTDLQRVRQTNDIAAQRSQILSEISEEDRQDFVRIERTLPASKEPLIVLRALQNVADEAGVSVRKFDTSPGVVSTGSAAVPTRNQAARRTQSFQISVEMEGGFQQVKEALELLESAAPIMEVTQLSLAPRSGSFDNEDSAVFLATVQITSYFFPPTGTAPTGMARNLTGVQRSAFDTVRVWQNRMPVNITPEIFSRTNLFRLEQESIPLDPGFDVFAPLELLPESEPLESQPQITEEPPQSL